MMYIDRAACDAFWQGYLAELPADHPHRRTKADAFGFGSEPAVAGELAELVLVGKKRATTSLPAEYAALGEPLPEVGDLEIVVRGDGQPVALIEYVKVSAMPFDDVGDEYAATEGEGDGTLAYWRNAHAEYFGEVCDRLGVRFDTRMPVLCKVFTVIRTSGGGPRI